MRAREILDEDYDQNLESDLINILIAAKGSGAKQIDTRTIVNQLSTEGGYSVDVDSLMLLLSQVPFVSATPTMITMTEPNAISPAGGDEEQPPPETDSAAPAQQGPVPPSLQNIPPK
jgi:hypothetical protein